jgi:hypothetical protein
MQWVGIAQFPEKGHCNAVAVRKQTVNSGDMTCVTRCSLVRRHASLEELDARLPVPLPCLGQLVHIRGNRNSAASASASGGCAKHQRSGQETNEMVLLVLKIPRSGPAHNQNRDGNSFRTHVRQLEPLGSSSAIYTSFREGVF